MENHFQQHSWISIKTIKIATLKKVCFAASLLLNYFAIVSQNKSQFIIFI